MAASHEAVELTGLEQTRSRLETALSRDENWRALTQSGAPAGNSEDGAARRARDTRLEMALEDNPFYRAWTHVNEAIDALRGRGSQPLALIDPPQCHEDGGDAGSTPPAGLADEDAPARAEEPTSADLPQDIVDLIRGSPSREDASVAGTDRSEVNCAADARAAREDGAAAASRSPVIPSVAPASTRAEHNNGDDAAPAQSHHRVADDWEEATVTFVTRVRATPRGSLLPAAELPADLGSGRKSALFERLRGVTDEPARPEDTFAPLNVDAEEAEITIVTPEDAQELRKTEQRAETLRRFRKALLGD